MSRLLVIVLYIINSLLNIQCGYPPIGDEIQTGSVVLPATRRGRYLANIVRRQAVDGTGIKFNKDADRMNAEAKKKVDVLSEELLPYIIAEQERRTTLYKRVMTALQNGEKGVTIAEIRNKPPVIIRKGLMYRCPTNRAPKEPDGSGVIMCEDNIDPTPIMYESCLSAEDKELYVADNKYFFCNRHKVEGPDLPRNGTTVIGCAPCERTSLNYTSAKCALEDTDDVVVHYRYYPDKTYKFVTELDPDREVCEHWNPCQIGYIFSLPSPDQATPASELWPDYILYDEDYESEEIVAEIPEDTPKESVKVPSDFYETTWVHIPIPEGTKYNGVIRMAEGLGRTRITNKNGVVPALKDHIEVLLKEKPGELKIKIKFSPIGDADVSNYYASFLIPKKEGSGKGEVKKYEYKLINSLERASIKVSYQDAVVIPGQTLNSSITNISCGHCTVKRVMVKVEDGTVANVPLSKYRVHKVDDNNNMVLELNLDKVTFADFGAYFVFLESNEINEEKIKFFDLTAPPMDDDNLLGLTRLTTTSGVGEHLDGSINYECGDCDILDVFCRGESQTKSGRITVITTSKLVNLNFPSFEDGNACVFIAVFEKAGKKYKKIVAVVENKSDLIAVSPANMVVPPPADGEQFEQEIAYKCTGSDCSVDKVFINGVPLITSTRRTNVGSIPFYVVGDNTITVRITQYEPHLEGVEQATFLVDNARITKTILEIGPQAAGAAGNSTLRRIVADPDGGFNEDEESIDNSLSEQNSDGATELSAKNPAKEATTAVEHEATALEDTTPTITTEDSDKKKKINKL